MNHRSKKADALWTKIEALHDVGDYARALPELRTLIRLIPEAPAFWSLLGVTLAELQRWKEAESAFRKALTIEPDHLTAHLGLSSMFAKRGRLDEAKACARQAVDAAPDDQLARDVLTDLNEFGHLT